MYIYICIYIYIILSVEVSGADEGRDADGVLRPDPRLVLS